MAAPPGPPEVQARLLAAAAGGILRFDRFVEIALYSEGGFYRSRESPLGRHGSFYTAAHASPLFGAALARRLCAERERLGAKRPFRVVEVGPGDGTLALDVARSLPTDGPRWRWTFVERSPTLRALLEERIRREAVGSPVAFDFAPSLGGEGAIVGAVVGNEFLDAQPFRRVVRHPGEWRELGVRWSGSSWEWAEGDGPTVVPGEPLPDAEGGTRYELLERAEGFVREVADSLAEGTAIFLDYGASTTELVRGHPGGTLAAVRGHHPVPPLEAPGSADLSAFVDFSRLRAAAARAGLRERAFRSQAEALGEWGIGPLIEGAVEKAESAEEGVRIRLAAKNLLFGFETFSVLELEAPGPTVMS
ncbi:MAG: SAM-dependent methyltransferase [Thermoplasmata archaeon]|nr:SAM-dependent methyltransferase [Thermoplasmata archaeon]MCI4362096.1 SAM-dependent methyltransferase [Thermoplasmata archaeon]